MLLGNTERFSNVRALYHVVFATKNREKSIGEEALPELYRICGVIADQKRCIVVKAGGTQNHVHLLVDVHPTVALAGLISHLKRKTTLWMHESGVFPHFAGWAREYFAHAVSYRDRAAVIAYIDNQPTYHLAYAHRHPASAAPSLPTTQGQTQNHPTPNVPVQDESFNAELRMLTANAGIIYRTPMVER
jgi:REP element-mobilizing transposase RayT